MNIKCHSSVGRRKARFIKLLLLKRVGQLRKLHHVNEDIIRLEQPLGLFFFFTWSICTRATLRAIGLAEVYRWILSVSARYFERTLSARDWVMHRGPRQYVDSMKLHQWINTECRARATIDEVVKWKKEQSISRCPLRLFRQSEILSSTVMFHILYKSARTLVHVNLCRK